MLRVTRGPIFRFFYLQNIFPFKKKLFGHSNLVFPPNFNAEIFYNFPNLVFLNFESFFKNNFCEFLNLVNVQII